MGKLLVTEAERRTIAREAVVMMGTKVQHKVIDLQKVVGWIRQERQNKNLSPYIDIQPISTDQFKTPYKQATFQKDPLTGVLYGIALSADEFGNIRWQKIQINEYLSLNLDNENDARVWAVIRFNPNILGSPFQIENPYFKVYDPVDEALAEEAEYESMQKAFERVTNLLKSPKQMVQFARFMGVEVMDNTTYEIVRGELRKIAKNQSGEFNKRWELRARSFAENFYSALALGIISEDANSGFFFEGIRLGPSQQDAIKMLSRDSSVMGSIVSQLDEKDKAVKSVSASIPKDEKKTKKKEPEPVEDGDFE